MHTMVMPSQWAEVPNVLVYQASEVPQRLRWSTGSPQSCLAAVSVWLGAMFKTQCISTQNCVPERNQRTGVGGKAERTLQL